MENIKQVFENEEVKNKFRQMLGKKAAGFMVSVINTVQNSDALKDADRNSVLFAAATAASLDLPINENLGFAYIVPYNKKNKDGTYSKQAQFQLGYKGFIQLAMRSGQFKTIGTTEVYEGQLVEENPLTGHTFNWSKKKSEIIIGYASYFSLTNGFNKTLYMTMDEVKKHGKSYSKTFTSKYGTWQTKFDAMAKKTVVKLLLSKYAPLSIEMQKAQITDQAIINDWDGNDIDYADNDRELLTSQQVSDNKEYERVLDQLSKCNSIEEVEMLEESIVDIDNEFKPQIDKAINELKTKLK